MFLAFYFTTSVKYIETIYAICRKFIWPTKHPPIAWSMFCKSTEDGGLGLKIFLRGIKHFLLKLCGKFT